MRLLLLFNVWVLVAITALFATGILMGSPSVNEMESDLDEIMLPPSATQLRSLSESETAEVKSPRDLVELAGRREGDAKNDLGR